MSILDDLGQLLDDILGAPPKSAGTGADGLGYGTHVQGLNDIQGLNPSLQNDVNVGGFPAGASGGGFGPDSRGLGPLPAPTQSPFSQSTEQIQGIQQVSTSPFKVFDILPYYLALSDFPCIYDKGTLTRLTGPEGSSEGAYFGTTNSGAQIDEAGPTKYWRTVAIEVNGNFAKIEYMPSRILNAGCTPLETLGGMSDASTGAGLSSTGGVIDGVIDEDYWFLASKNNNRIYPNASAEMEHMSKKLILVSFDAQTNIPLVCVSGTVFKCPFNKIYVSFKTGAGPIRVTSGYNAEIVSAPDSVELNANLAMKPSNGFLEKPLLHYVPFCVTSSDNLAASTARTVAAGGSEVLTIVDAIGQTAIAPSDTRKGIGILWITGFSLNVTSTGAVVSRNYGVTLYVADAASGALKRIVYRRQSYTVIVAAENSVSGFDKDFNTPIRVCLHQPSEVLKMKFINPTSADEYYEFTLYGYTHGRWRYESAHATDYQIPMVLLDLVNEHPYYLDNQRTIGAIVGDVTLGVTGNLVIV